MQDVTSQPARLPMFFGLYMAEALCWSTGASCLPGGTPCPPADPTSVTPAH